MHEATLVTSKLLWLTHLMPKSLGLGVKFVLLVSLILLLTLGAMTGYRVQAQDEQLQQHLKAEGTILGRFVALISPEAILAFDYESLNSYVREGARGQDVVYAVILDPSGANLTSYLDTQDPMIQAAMRTVGSVDLKGPNFKIVVSHLQQAADVVHLEFPIERNGKAIARVIVGMSKQRLEAAARAAAWQQSVLNGLIIVFLSSSLYGVFRHNALRPIRALGYGSERIASGDLATSVEVFSNDELGHLSVAFNDMMQRLALTLGEKDQALHSLHDLNKSLEDRVAQRTLELERSETRMRAIFDSVGEGIITLNARGYVMSMNPAAERMFAVQSLDSDGIHSTLLLADVHTDALASLPNYDESKNSVFQISSGITPVEYQGRGFGGREFPMELIVTAIQQDEEELRVCVLRDITRRYAAHKSGMAEIAIGVLHNVGNILNSVMLSGEEIARMAKNSKVAGLNKANEMLRDHAHDLGSFFTTNDKGKMLPQYYEKIGLALGEEIKSISSEASKLNEKLGMMKDVIATQQAYARVDTYVDLLNVTTVIEDALRVQEASLHKLGVSVRKNFQYTPACSVHKSKFLQVLTNLIQNAKEATAENDQLNRVQEIVLETGCIESGDVFISITDNGCGIAAEHLQCIFNHGFTTKPNGHGFGLHTSALAMTDMGGALRVHSDGPGQGATFTLTLRAGQEKTTRAATSAAVQSSAA